MGLRSGNLDAAFVQEPEHRKPAVAESGSIPIIDLSSFLLRDPLLDGVDVAAPSLQQLLAEVEAACRDWGFFQVINHGVPDEIVEKAWAASKGFFGLPEEERLRVKRDEVNPLGYYDKEHTKNVRDWNYDKEHTKNVRDWKVFDFVVQEPVAIPALDPPGGLIELRNQWPQYPPGFREACEEYARVLTDLAFKLLELIALTLNLPAVRLNDFFKDHTSFIRLNHYPPCPSPDLALGFGRHKDAGVLTILVQDDVGGLDVKRRSDGEWVRVKPIPNSFIINVGDIIQVWSNDKYESAEHRVSVNTEKERFSIPFFFNPSHYVMVKPLEEVVDAAMAPANYEEYNWGKFFKTRKDSNFKKLEVEMAPANYEEYNWGKFFKTRKDSNFKKLEVENVQIYHFKKLADKVI